MDPYHDCVPEGARWGGRGRRGLPRTQLRPGLGRVAWPPGRRGRAAGGAEHDVGGEHTTLAIERRWACRDASRGLAGRRTLGLLAARSGRVRPNMGHLQAHHEAPGPRLCLAASGRRRKGNHRTAEWTVTNGHETFHAANFLELRQSEVRRIHLLRGWVNKAKEKGQSVVALAPPTLSTLVGEEFSYL